MLVVFVFKSKMLQVLRTSFCVLLRVLLRGTGGFLNLLFQLVLCNAVVIGAAIFSFTQSQANVFDFTAIVYIYFAFTSLVIVVELCTLLRYEVIELKYR